MHLHIAVFGDTQFSRDIRLVGRRAQQAKPAMDAVAWYLSKVAEQQFDTEGARGGRPWQPLADSTVRRKGHARILFDSGDLKDSFKYGDEQNIWDVSDDGLEWGSRNPYGIFHQQGTVHLPEREPFVLTNEDRVKITKSIQRWVVEGDTTNLEVGAL